MLEAVRLQGSYGHSHRGAVAMVLAAPTAGRCKAFGFFLKQGREAVGTRGHSSMEAFREVFKEADNDLALKLGQLRCLSLSGSLFFLFCIIR